MMVEKPFSAHGDIEMPVLVLRHRHLVRIEAVAAQEREIPFGQIIHLALHEGDLVFGYYHMGHQPYLFFQQFAESMWKLLSVAVEERVLDFRARIFLQHVILAAERICVVICEMLYDLFHYFSVGNYDMLLFLSLQTVSIIITTNFLFLL